MVRTWRQQASFDEIEEEAEFFLHTNLEHKLIKMDNSLEAEGINCMMGCTNNENGDFEKQSQDLRKVCVSEKSQNNYLMSLINMINWFALNTNKLQYNGFIPLMQSWRDQFITFDNETKRKIWIQSKLDDANLSIRL